jgi:hypothetical protein
MLWGLFYKPAVDTIVLARDPEVTPLRRRSGPSHKSQSGADTKKHQKAKIVISLAILHKGWLAIFRGTLAIMKISFGLLRARSARALASAYGLRQENPLKSWRRRGKFRAPIGGYRCRAHLAWRRPRVATEGRRSDRFRRRCRPWLRTWRPNGRS